MTRRRLLKSALGFFAAGAAASVYMRWVEPTWLSVTQMDLAIPRLPSAWEGARVVQLSDIHVGDSVPDAYLERAFDHVAELEPALVAITGDFATHPSESHEERLLGLLARLSPPLGVFGCLGNHEYALSYPVPRADPHPVVEYLRRSNLRLLRNDAAKATRDGADLWIVGLDDLWAGRLDPPTALAKVPPGAAALTLCHNPDAADDCAAAGCETILCGHTHGGQVHLPLIGPVYVPVVNKHLYAGLYQVGGAQVYVNRGLGWVIRARLACRPEITVFTLRGKA
jgi:predicted MPP superfamily phosphohydrolase